MFLIRNVYQKAYMHIIEDLILHELLRKNQYLFGVHFQKKQQLNSATYINAILWSKI